MTRADAQSAVDALTDALNAAIADIESSGLFRASVVTSWDNSGGPQSVRVEVRERSKFELELMARRPA